MFLIDTVCETLRMPNAMFCSPLIYRHTCPFYSVPEYGVFITQKFSIL